MKKIIPFLFTATLIACGRSEAPQQVNTSEANVPTVEELAAKPERLKELRRWQRWRLPPAASDSAGRRACPGCGSAAPGAGR